VRGGHDLLVGSTTSHGQSIIAELGCCVVKRTQLVGLVVAGVVLAVVGAVVRFSTTVHSSGFNAHKVGDVLLAVGVVLIVVAAVIGARRRNITRR
jgi:uncharacterized membrane protein